MRPMAFRGNATSFHVFDEDRMVTIMQWLIFMWWNGLIWMLNQIFNCQDLTMTISLLRINHGCWLKIKRRSNGHAQNCAYFYSLSST